MTHEKLNIILSMPWINNQALYRTLEISSTTLEEYRKGKKALTPEMKAKITKFLNERGNYFLNASDEINNVDLATKSDMINYWAEQLANKNLSKEKLIENATWLINKLKSLSHE